MRRSASATPPGLRVPRITSKGDAPLSPLSSSRLLGYLRNAKVDAEQLAQVFEASDGVEAFAQKASAKGDDAAAHAKALVDELSARRKQRSYVIWSTHAPRESTPLSASDVAERVSESGKAHRLYPLEVAVLAAATLRTQGIHAMVSEVYAFDGDRRPPDPSGHIGYYGIAVAKDADAPDATEFFDPYGGRTTSPGDDDMRTLSDVQVVAAYLGLKALRALVHEQDVTRAVELIDQALQLDRRGPTIRSVRGAILVVAGAAKEGVGEFLSASQIRNDAPRLNNLAGVRLAQGDLEAASKDVARALQAHPDFAGGHATLAAVHLSQGETPQARGELDLAERLDADLPTLPLLWAQYYLSQREPERALEYARQAVRRRGHDMQTRISAAQVFRAAGDYDAMREQARAVVEMADEKRRPQMERVITELLGPTALEPPLADEAADDEDDLDLPGAAQLPGAAELG